MSTYIYIYIYPLCGADYEDVTWGLVLKLEMHWM